MLKQKSFMEDFSLRKEEGFVFLSHHSKDPPETILFVPSSLTLYNGMLGYLDGKKNPFSQVFIILIVSVPKNKLEDAYKYYLVFTARI